MWVAHVQGFSETGEGYKHTVRMVLDSGASVTRYNICGANVQPSRYAADACSYTVVLPPYMTKGIRFAIENDPRLTITPGGMFIPQLRMKALCDVVVKTDGADPATLARGDTLGIRSGTFTRASGVTVVLNERGTATVLVAWDPVSLAPVHTSLTDTTLAIARRIGACVNDVDMDADYIVCERMLVYCDEVLAAMTTTGAKVSSGFFQIRMEQDTQSGCIVNTPNITAHTPIVPCATFDAVNIQRTAARFTMMSGYTLVIKEEAFTLDVKKAIEACGGEAVKGPATTSALLEACMAGPCHVPITGPPSAPDALASYTPFIKDTDIHPMCIFFLLASVAYVNVDILKPSLQPAERLAMVCTHAGWTEAADVMARMVRSGSSIAEQQAACIEVMARLVDHRATSHIPRSLAECCKPVA